MKKYFSYKIAFYYKIKLKKKHWFIINKTIKFYKIYGISPTIKMLIFFIKKNTKKKINLVYLKKLFNNNPKKLINQISGIPKSNSCFK